jgi:Rod binding domain-containing protein
MTLPIHSAGTVTSATEAKANTQANDPKLAKAAKEFEAIFLRTLLSSLEKTTSMSGSGKLTTSQSTYGSMVVGAMADQIASSGGIGLAEIIERSVTGRPGLAPAPEIPESKSLK